LDRQVGDQLPLDLRSVLWRLTLFGADRRRASAANTLQKQNTLRINRVSTEIVSTRAPKMTAVPNLGHSEQ
jgi:hypothetical protein